jgi:formyltetrahydrofolate deformylase
MSGLGGEQHEERLLLTCPDRPGIVAAVTGLLAEHGANVLDLDQHAEPDSEAFAMRVSYMLPAGREAERLREEMEGLRERFEMSVRFSDPERQPPVAILCSSEGHCLNDLLWRFDSGAMPGRVTTVISTVDAHRERVDSYRTPFHHLPVERSDQMPAHEELLLELLAGKVELVILARYMRILSPRFLAEVGCPVINIHHSFLPAFVGADPYLRAHERGVKLIGATAHYATAELDAGPIIEQDVARVSHRDSVKDLERIGQDVERVVLARAVRAHLEDRVAIWENRTVVL